MDSIGDIRLDQTNQDHRCPKTTTVSPLLINPLLISLVVFQESYVSMKLVLAGMVMME